MIQNKNAASARSVQRGIEIVLWFSHLFQRLRPFTDRLGTRKFFIEGEQVFDFLMLFVQSVNDFIEGQPKLIRRCVCGRRRERGSVCGSVAVAGRFPCPIRGRRGIRFYPHLNRVTKGSGYPVDGDGLEDAAARRRRAVAPMMPTATAVPASSEPLERTNC